MVAIQLNFREVKKLKLIILSARGREGRSHEQISRIGEGGGGGAFLRPCYSILDGRFFLLNV